MLVSGLTPAHMDNDLHILEGGWPTFSFSEKSGSATMLCLHFPSKDSTNTGSTDALVVCEDLLGGIVTGLLEMGMD
jgi:hypothetical protein